MPGIFNWKKIESKSFIRIVAREIMAVGNEESIIVKFVLAILRLLMSLEATIFIKPPKN
jgi:hypothetical protein